MSVIDPAADWSTLPVAETWRQEVLHVAAASDDSLRSRDAIIAWGERLAVALLQTAISAPGGVASGIHAWSLDEPLICTDDHFGEAVPDIDATRLAAQPLLERIGNGILVLPGFIGHSEDGSITTLGRGGSDYSATLLAAAMGADACWIYTDVDGIFTADPRLVRDSLVLPVVSASTAGRLALCGAKVLHPRSVAPVARLSIELRVRNSFKPEHPGTLIASTDTETRCQPQAVAARKQLSAMNLTGRGLAAIPTLFSRMCGAVAAAGAEIVQAALPVPGHDPQVIVDTAQAPKVERQLYAEFAAEYAHAQMGEIQCQDGLALCALVGDELSAATLLQAQRALAAERIVPQSQSANADALCFIINATDADRAVRALHREVIIPAFRVMAQRRQRPYADGHWAAGGRPQQRRRFTSPQH